MMTLKERTKHNNKWIKRYLEKIRKETNIEMRNIQFMVLFIHSVDNKVIRKNTNYLKYTMVMNFYGYSDLINIKFDENELRALYNIVESNKYDIGLLKADMGKYSGWSKNKKEDMIEHKKELIHLYSLLMKNNVYDEEIHGIREIEILKFKGDLYE